MKTQPVDFEREAKAAMHKSQAAINANYWVVTLGLRPTRDGDQYCFLWGDNLHEGVAGLGDTPYEALLDFETAMHTARKQGTANA